MLNTSQLTSTNNYPMKYLYGLVFQMILCAFVVIMMLVNMSVLHTPMMLGVQYPLVLTFFCDIYYRSSKNLNYLNSYLNIMDVAFMSYLFYLTVVISYSDVSLKQPFYVVLQSIDIVLVVAILLRLASKMQRYRQARKNGGDNSQLLAHILELDQTLETCQEDSHQKNMQEIQAEMHISEL